jgi:hypothetical protein
VYARRMKRNKRIVPTVTLMSANFLSRSTPTCETPNSDLEYSGDIVSLDSPLTIMPLRQTLRPNTKCPPYHYGFLHDIV